MGFHRFPLFIRNVADAYARRQLLQSFSATDRNDGLLFVADILN